LTLKDCGGWRVAREIRNQVNRKSIENTVQSL
jgi:hypothetical protein